MKRREKNQNDWISGEDYFGAELRRSAPFLFLLINFFCVPFLLAGILAPGDGWIVGFILIVTLNLFFVWFSVRLIQLKRTQRKFILWDHCNSTFAVEPFNVIMHALKAEEVSFHIASGKEKSEIKTFAPHFTLELEEEDIAIEFWVSLSGGYFFNVLPRNWVCIRSNGKNSKSTNLSFVTNLIENIVKGLPEKNSFCRNCNKSQDATCYGANFITREGISSLKLRKLLIKVEPYKDKQIFNELVEKKKNLDDRIFDLKRFEKEFRKFIEEVEVCE